ncbi:hypothetical protein [uncultured Pseudoalteromonas sp.]|uniref:hypothetical protein n=1 Tax=uncultured Pseudoalteromonas sp. TaxID=114053 RepID=UPI002598A257|nr:hypothetical protein [uncultured Pseudoalteromonas sp.]
MSKTYQIDQMALFSAISKELTRQHPDMPVISSVFNKCIEAANLICDECEREQIMARKGMSLLEWFNCDDTGLSSRYMARVIDGSTPHQILIREYEYPRDADDLGRCIRMVRACGLENHVFLLLTTGHEWHQIANDWEKLVTWYDQNNWGELNIYFSNIRTR